MTYAQSMAAMNAKRKEIEALQGEMRTLLAAVEPEVVRDYVLDAWDGPVRLSELFGDKRDLILIHNMGVGCPSCTMWADGFNGVYDHLASRAAFVVASPNPVEAQKQVAASRGWRFRMVSYAKSDLAQDLGYRHRADDPFDESMGGWNAGVSIFRRDGDRILRLSDAEFDDLDGFCVVFHLFDLLPEGTAGWRPATATREPTRGEKAMNYAQTMSAMTAKRQRIAALRGQMRAIQAAVEPEVVQDYVLDGWDGPVRLSELFGDKRDLIVIHNMGKGCPSCTMWADGFNGVYDHLASRAAFVVSSPNPVDVQKTFAGERGWRFPMVSHAGTSFAADMGYRRLGADAGGDALGGWWPGVSLFRLDDQRVLRVSDTELGPGDDLCVVYSLFDLVPGSSLNWEPKYKYA